MNTLLIRLAGPMQSWGTQSRFFTRDTGHEPSKSGVIGVLCAALGWGREAPLDDLARLRMGVRVDQAGVMKMDYQTAGGGNLPNGSSYGVRRANDTRGETVLSNRYYLADADFLVGLESDDAALRRRLDTALREPIWQLYLGRKAFVPGVPVYILGGLREGESLEDALGQYPWPRFDLDVPRPGRRPGQLRLTIEHPDGAEVRMDQPYGASFVTRSFLPRRVQNSFLNSGAGDGEVPVREDTREDVDVLVTPGDQSEEP